jgi:hypothetical protein
VPARDNVIIPVICEVLEKYPGLEANELLEAVTPLYSERKGTNLYRRHFFKYLGLMIKNGSVDKLGTDKRGKPVELYLTEKGKRQYHQQSFDVLSVRTEPRTDDISQELKALYTTILYFNHGVSYEVYTEDAAEYILKSIGLSLATLIGSGESRVKRDSEDVAQNIFQSPRQDAIVYKDMFLRSDIYESGTKRYRLFLRGITCEAVLESKDVKAFKHFRFISEDIRSAIGSLCSLNVLKPMGSLGPTIDSEVIYKIDKSIFDFMFCLHSLIDYDIFDKIESIMKDIWSSVRPPTPDEKDWLYFIYGEKEADRLINDAHDSRYKITNGESMKSYISRITRNNKEKLNEMNNRIDAINKEITKIKDDISWIQESYRATIDRHQVLINNIYETVYPRFFANLTLEKFGVKRQKQW